MGNRETFRQWLIDTGRKGAANNYPKAIINISNHYSENTGKEISIYEISNSTEISQIARQYKQDGKFSEYGYRYKGLYRNAIARYSEFFAEINTMGNALQDSDIEVDIPTENKQQQSNFRYENDLQTTFCSQISELFPDYDILGREYPINGKRIDVLLQHRETENLLVVELKAGRTDNSVFGQISMYIGMLQQLPSFSNKTIEGVIIAGAADEGLSYACKTNRSISVKIYRMSIELEDTDVSEDEIAE